MGISRSAIVGAVLAAGLTIPVVAAASDEATTSTPTTATPTNSGPTGGQPGTGGLNGERRQEWLAEIAAELGIDTDTLQDAVTTIRLRHLDERLDRAVEHGRMTQAEADAIAAAAEQGDWPARRRGR